ncbi:HEXXH motif domain-containing protein, partial [Frankia sp. AiPs1]|nr:HEXXH motif domain-containing protein [Frankia sp. AiPs1]
PRADLHLPGAATAGDLAAVAGDIARAAVEFRRELRERPGRVESFAGLALIHAARVGGGLERRLCLDHPEALLALGERIRAATGRTPDLPDLTAWIAAGPAANPARPVARMVAHMRRVPASATC